MPPPASGLRWAAPLGVLGGGLRQAVGGQAGVAGGQSEGNPKSGERRGCKGPFQKLQSPLLQALRRGDVTAVPGVWLRAAEASSPPGVRGSLRRRCFMGVGIVFGASKLQAFSRSPKRDPATQAPPLESRGSHGVTSGSGRRSGCPSGLGPHPSGPAGGSGPLSRIGDP